MSQHPPRAVLHSKRALIYACLGTLALNVVLFVLLPELVREPPLDIGRAYTEPVRIQLPQPAHTAPSQLQHAETTPTQLQTQTPPPPPLQQISALAPLPALVPLMPELDAGLNLPPVEFTPAGVGEVYGVDMDMGVDVGAGSAAAPQVYASAALDQPLRPIAQTPFIYPLRAKRQGTEGWVKVALQVGIGGEVETVEVLEAEPAGVFDHSVTRGIRQWRFSPATVMGERVRARVVTTIRFELED